MREIRFRAWDEVLGEWYMDGNPLDLNYCCEQGMLLFDNDSPADIRDASLVLVQFTGLHDKNGTPIYEGDVLQHPDGETGVVEWDKIMSSVRVVYSKDFSGALFKQIGEKGLATVIGNKFEHPNLVSNET